MCLSGLLYAPTYCLVSFVHKRHNSSYPEKYTLYYIILYLYLNHLAAGTFTKCTQQRTHVGKINVKQNT